MKILIATGGSGGHIFPALSVAEVLRHQGHEVVFTGCFRGWTQMIEKKGFVMEDLPAQGVIGKSFKETFAAVRCMVKSFYISCHLIRRYQPDRVIGFGGYASFSVVLAAKIKGTMTLIHEQNVIPGKANRTLSFVVDRVFISFAQSRRFFPKKKTVETGYPLRAFNKNLSRQECRRHFGLSENTFTIVICGGSQGSRALNQVMARSAELMLKEKDFQVIHIAGGNDRELLCMAYQQLGICHYVAAFVQEIELAYGAADIVITRAGAGVLHEIADFSIPAIVIPYPFAGGHQKHNAVAFLEKNRGVLIEEKYLKAERLCAEILCLANSHKRSMKDGAQAQMHHGNAAEVIARHILRGTV